MKKLLGIALIGFASLLALVLLTMVPSTISSIIDALSVNTMAYWSYTAGSIVGLVMMIVPILLMTWGGIKLIKKNRLSTLPK